MARYKSGFRLKMVYTFGLSLLLSGLSTYVIYRFLQNYYYDHADYGGVLFRVRLFMNMVGDLYFFLLLFIPMAILFFFILTKKYSVYFSKISSGIHDLAIGDFTKEVNIQSNDEFESVATDINTAKKQLKMAIEKGEFQESSKDYLVGNLAHDLRTPLTSLMGYLEIVMQDESLTEQQKQHFLKIVHTKSQRLERLIDELFEMTKLNYGKAPLRKETIDLTELLQQLTEEMYLFQAEQVEVRTHLPTSLMITGDGSLLARLFENLLSNAGKYGTEGCYIDVEGIAVDEEAIEIRVINYGNQIIPEDLPHVFDMFYTGDKARNHEVSQRSGLGLFIAQNIAEQHEGTIDVESDAIKTTFRVQLPVRNQDI
ncbi:LOW QUALITY PROTEIN: sensor histidine kinase [Geomicrobium sp. JCM 19038]|nr:LOW QUALITY PROTEIN: sensor histidine kinase [Geomicrobium sp. JCM 19038]